MTTAPTAWSSAPVIAAAITALFALIGTLVSLVVNQYRARQDERRKEFAAALAAVERYAELPYRIRRRQGSTPEVRECLSEKIHEVQQDLLFHQSWVRIQDPRVADAYETLVGVTRQEAGRAMTEAWRTDPITADENMPLGMGFSFSQMRDKRAEYVEVVRWRLQPALLRWLRERLIPWLLDLLVSKSSGSQSP